MIDTAIRAEIRRLFFAEHWKVGTIAAELDVHRDTVTRAIEVDRFVARGARPSTLDPFLPFVEQTLKQYPRLTATRVHQMLKARGYPGSEAQVRRRIRDLGLRPRPAAEAFLRLSLIPGEQGQVDWAHLGRLRIGRADRPLYAFVVVLSWSRAVHVHFTLDQTMASVVRGHVAAFEAFGGVPRQLLYDNMKTAVVERVGNAIRFHDRLLELAAHYHFAPHACRPARGNEKGRVERRIRDLRTSFLAGRRFFDLAELRTQFAQWRAEVAHRRACPADPSITVEQALQRERDVLLPLPQHPIGTDDVRAVVAQKQPYVTCDTNRYSIPFEYVGIPLTLAAGETAIRVLHGDEVIARHGRCWDRRRTIENPEHVEALLAHKRKGRVHATRTRLLDAVPRLAELYAELARRGEPMGSNTARLDRLLARHGAADLRAAVDVALERGTPRATSVEHVLSRRARERGDVPCSPLLLTGRDDVRHLETDHHDLGDYDDLT